MAQRTQRVDVRPRTLLPLLRILLHRRIPRRQDRRHRSALRHHRLPRRPEIQQHRRAVLIAQHDVPRLDVPVHHPGAVHLLQTVQQRQQNAPHFRLRQRLPILQPLRKRLPLHILHRDVAGAVGAEEAVDLHDAAVPEARQHPRLLKEAVQAPLEDILVGLRPRRHRQAALADGAVRGQVFLDGDRDVEFGVPAQVGDAEAAGAEEAAQFELLQLRPFRERLTMYGMVAHEAGIVGIGV